MCTYILIFFLQPGLIGDVLGVADPLVHAVGLVLSHQSCLHIHPLVFLQQVVECMPNLMNHFQSCGLKMETNKHGPGINMCCIFQPGFGVRICCVF